VLSQPIDNAALMKNMSAGESHDAFLEVVSVSFVRSNCEAKVVLEEREGLTNTELQVKIISLATCMDQARMLSPHESNLLLLLTLLNRCNILGCFRQLNLPGRL
jgi:hypothetical protein